MSIWVSDNHSFGETELLSMIHNDARRNKDQGGVRRGQLRHGEAMS